MSRSALLTLLAAAAAAGLAGCFPKVGAAPGPLAAVSLPLAQSRYENVSMESLEQGRQLFLKSCKDCHGYPDLLAYPEEKWPAAATKMAQKANLSAAEAELLTRFVVVARVVETIPAANRVPPPAATP